MHVVFAQFETGWRRVPFSRVRIGIHCL
jgi:hypothetical protein